MPGGQRLRHLDGRFRRCGCDLGTLDHRPPGLLPLAEALQGIIVGDRPGLAPVSDDALPRPAVAQQPGQAAVGLVLRGGPPGHHLGLGPGECDIHQPAVVTGGLAAPQHLDRGEVRCVSSPDVETANIVVVEQDQITLLDVAVESERQVHDRELQALTAPDRHDLHRLGIAVEASVALHRPAALLTATA